MGTRAPQLLGELWHCSLGTWQGTPGPPVLKFNPSLISWENKANADRLDTSICWWWCKAPVMFLWCQIAHPPARRGILSHITLNISLWDLFLRPKSYLLTSQPCFHLFSVMSLIHKTRIKSKYLWFGLPKFKDLPWPWHQKVALTNQEHLSQFCKTLNQIWSQWWHLELEGAQCKPGVIEIWKEHHGTAACL